MEYFWKKLFKQTYDIKSKINNYMYYIFYLSPTIPKRSEIPTLYLLFCIEFINIHILI